MKIYIKCDDNFKVNILDANYNFIKQVSDKIINIELENDEYIKIYVKDKESELIRLSNLISELEVIYNESKDKLEVNLFNYNESNYGEVRVVTLKDEKNLFFRDDKSKVINILLPKDYSNEKKYGLLIAFDSQNIYDAKKVGNYTSKNDPYGGWQVEATLSKTKDVYNKEYIVVGIEDCDKYRDIELTPSSRNYKFKDILYELEETSLLKGEMEYFNDFINETLFPYILSNYNIDLDEVGIFGASSGGLASYYIGLKNSSKYKFILTFTPATGFIKDESLKDFYGKIDFNSRLPFIFYFQGKKGWLEELLYTVNIDLIKNLVDSNYSKDLIDEYLEESYEHNEVAWRFSFNYAMDVYLRRGK